MDKEIVYKVATFCHSKCVEAEILPSSLQKIFLHDKMNLAIQCCLAMKFRGAAQKFSRHQKAMNVKYKTDLQLHVLRFPHYSPVTRSSLFINYFVSMVSGVYFAC